MRATLEIAPEALAECLPLVGLAGLKITGSLWGDGVIKLVVEGAAIVCPVIKLEVARSPNEFAVRVVPSK